MPKDKRIRLAALYFALCTTPGMPNQIVEACADTLQVLIRSKNKLSIDDMRLPWKPIYNILSRDLFLTRREFEYTYVDSAMISRPWDLTYGSLCQRTSLVYGVYCKHVQKIFPPCCDRRNVSNIRTSDKRNELGCMLEDVDPVIRLNMTD
jgi:hypothetical protein